MFKKILVANRGEIAVRAIRACRELGVRSVAVYSEADRNALHVKLADEAVCIGPAEPSRSYLDVPSIMSAAEVSGADAVYPGYGFLAENPKFAEIVSKSGIKFIGPSPQTLELIGDKIRTKEVAGKVGIPLVPGSSGATDLEGALKVASRIGYPVVLKASAGGGGRGIRIVMNEKELREKFQVAVQEAEISFGIPGETFSFWGSGSARSREGTRSWWRRLRAYRSTTRRLRAYRSTTEGGGK